MTEAADSSAVSRREAVAMIGAAAGAIFAPPTAVNGEEAAANTVSCIVYEDRSRAGTRQASDRGLAGSIGGRKPIDMRRIRRPDPVVQQIYLRNPTTTKSWVKAEPSSHIWMGRLPGDLEPGTHRADVQVTDEYGRELQDHLLIEVVVGATTTAPRRT
jgi:hypothetical protein